MSNIRVYDFSKELNISNKEVIEIANRLGISIRRHTSSITDEDARRIRETAKSPRNQGSVSTKEKVEEPDEAVKIIRSDGGEEVVERRKGKSVILRKKKKIEEPIIEEATLQELESSRISEIAIEDIPQHIPEEQIEEKKILVPIIEQVLSSEAEKVIVPEEIASPEVVQVEQQKKKEEEKEKQRGEEEDKTKRKGRKVKVKKEEIIDEDTLEELRRAFKTKLPVRKREYLVEDRRSRSRAGLVSTYRDKSSSRVRKEYTRGSEVPYKDNEFADVIPFPTKQVKRTIKVGESITIGELAKRMGVKAGELIKKFMELGAIYTINQSIDPETISIVAEELGFDVIVDKFEEEQLLFDQDKDANGEYKTRPPVVTVMGHVDHGKTTLLDTIRKTKVVSEEHGGITQHIGAYCVSLDGRKVVFIDTPGHEAFTAMRARGAKVTDIVILVVAADDGVMPQTTEAINHAKAAGVPIIVAINKIDKPGSNPDLIRRQLSETGLIPEEWGGDTLFSEVSAKGNKGIKELLELVLLQADVLELKAIDNKRANGVVIEAELNKGRGPTATVIINEGTLRVGDCVVAGVTFGRIRALLDDKGSRLSLAGPSMPIEIMGLSGVPVAGERFNVVKDEKTARDIANYRETKERQRITATRRKLSLEDLFESIEKEGKKELLLIIKADTQGSVEVVKESVLKLSTPKCSVKVVHAGVGAINETDVNLASASNAVILGFNARPDAKAHFAAEREGVSLEIHTIIYDAVDRIKKAMEGLLEPVLKEKVAGHAEVKAIFNISRVGSIAGCKVLDGKVSRGNNVRVMREGSSIFDGKLNSLKRFKDDVREVQSGFECGIGIESFNDIKIGDNLEFYALEEIRQEL